MKEVTIEITPSVTEVTIEVNQGIQGPTGKVGPIGATGVKGEKGDAGAVGNHSALNLDDGTNPHGTTIADVDANAANIAYTNVANPFTEDQKIEGSKKLKFGDEAYIWASGSILYFEVINPITSLIRSRISINSDNKTFVSAIQDFDLGNSILKWKELFLSSYANVLGIKSVENDSNKVFASNGEVVDLPKPTETTNTGSSIDLTNSAGNYKTDQTNNATSYTVPTEVMGGWEQRLINAATEPTVSGALKIKGSDFVANTNMYLVTWNNGNINEYHFQEI